MAGDTEQSFLEDFVLLVPKGKARADVLMGVAVTANPILALYHQYWAGWRDLPNGRSLSGHAREETRTTHPRCHYHIN